VGLARAFYATSVALAQGEGGVALIMDDPLSAVDAHVGGEMLASIVGMKGSGVTRILVTHAMHTLSSSDFVVVMSDGKIVQSGTPESLASAPCPELERLLHAHGDGAALLRGASSSSSSPETVSVRGNPDPHPPGSAPGAGGGVLARVSPSPNPAGGSAAGGGDKQQQTQPTSRQTTVENREKGAVAQATVASYINAMGGAAALATVLSCYLAFYTFSLGGIFWLSSWSAR